MLEKIRNVLLVVVFIICVIAFTAWMQTDYELCDGLGFPICTD